MINSLICALLRLRLLLLSSLLLLASCESELIKPDSASPVASLSREARTAPGHTTTFYGPAVPFGKGVARTWVLLGVSGEPVSIGLDITEKALSTLTASPEEIVLFFPKKGKLTQFQTVTVGWNPAGHVPPGIYDVPHIDVHFNMIPEEERLAIPAIAPPYMDPAPAAQYIPPAYLQVPGVEPHMGAHWIDLLSSEFQGGSFSNTLILGTYDAKLIFIEPMLTIAYLETHPDETRAIRQPAAFQFSGYYPASYKVSFRTHPNTFSVSLDELVYHTGAEEE